MLFRKRTPEEALKKRDASRLRRLREARGEETTGDANGPRRGGLGFFLALPISLFLAYTCVSVLISLLQRLPLQEEAWALFACGFIATASILGNCALPRLRTFIHEIKHAVVVLATGNKLIDFHVARDTGHVSYQLDMERVHLAPLISLAPYYLPFFSFPVLVCAIIWQDWRLVYASILGAALAADLSFAIKEVHPYQSDFRQVVGGVLTSAAFIVGTTLLWISLCLLWLVGGRKAFVLVSYTLYGFLRTLI